MKIFTIVEFTFRENRDGKVFDCRASTKFLTPSLEKAQKKMDLLCNKFMEECGAAVEGAGSDMDMCCWSLDREKMERRSARWLIQEHDVPISETEVCVEVEGGMVQNIFTKGTAPLLIKVLDMDISPSGDSAEAEEKQLAGQREEIEHIKKSPEWKVVW